MSGTVAATQGAESAESGVPRAPGVRKVTEADLAQLSETLAAAFLNDPVLS